MDFNLFISIQILSRGVYPGTEEGGGEKANLGI